MAQSEAHVIPNAKLLQNEPKGFPFLILGVEMAPVRATSGPVGQTGRVQAKTDFRDRRALSGARKKQHELVSDLDSLNV